MSFEFFNKHRELLSGEAREENCGQNPLSCSSSYVDFEVNFLDIFLICHYLVFALKKSCFFLFWKPTTIATCNTSSLRIRHYHTNPETRGLFKLKGMGSVNRYSSP